MAFSEALPSPQTDHELLGFYRDAYEKTHARAEALEKDNTRLYEQQALHTESYGIVCAERDRAVKALSEEQTKYQERFRMHFDALREVNRLTEYAVTTVELLRDASALLMRGDDDDQKLFGNDWNAEQADFMDSCRDLSHEIDRHVAALSIPSVAQEGAGSTPAQSQRPGGTGAGFESPEVARGAEGAAGTADKATAESVAGATDSLRRLVAGILKQSTFDHEGRLRTIYSALPYGWIKWAKDAGCDLHAHSDEDAPELNGVLPQSGFRDGLKAALAVIEKHAAGIDLEATQFEEDGTPKGIERADQLDCARHALNLVAEDITCLDPGPTKAVHSQLPANGLCGRCRMRAIHHRPGDSACPVIANGRRVGWSAHAFLVELTDKGAR